MSTTVVGIISDTHGLMRPQALDALRGSDLIIHAGDVGKPAVLDALRAIAPIYAVRGNIDTGEWALALPLRQQVTLAAHRLLVLHDISELDVDPAAAGLAAVVFGHSHMPAIEQREGVLFLNPGSAGPRRFKLPVALARIRVSRRTLRPEIMELAV